MIAIRNLHQWKVTPKRAIAIQRTLCDEVIEEPPDQPIQLVAGCDLAFVKGGDRCVAGVVVWDVKGHCVVQERVACRPVTFPYIPGLLSFREAPALLAAIAKLDAEPDAFMFDGHGRSHPRRMGLACHVALFLDRPGIGCAKSLLTGSYREPQPRRGSSTSLRDGSERIGTVLRTRDGVKPVFVSIGHRMDLPTAQRVVMSCCTRYRLPEPTRLADRLVAQRKQEFKAP